MEATETVNELKSENESQDTTSLDREALHGLAGDIVRAIDPFTESDSVAVLTNVLSAFGNIIGPTPHFRVESTYHHLNLFIAQVGNTAKGRKGTGWSTPKRIFKEIDHTWADSRIMGGLSTGEGLIYQVRDKRIEKTPIKENGRVIDYQEVIVDHGADDKRLLLVEEEMSQALKVMLREGNILSPTLRQAWDGGDLNPLTRNNQIKATGAHISIISHITKSELLRYITATEQANGFANRFCWFLVKRSKLIPNPVGVPESMLSPLIGKLRDAVEHARKVGEIRRDPAAETVWAEIYPELSAEKPGLSGATVSRAEPQVMRLACIYALLDQSEAVRLPHLKAALAVWEYSEHSAMAIFGDITGDPAVDKAKEALKLKGTMTLTDLHALFGRNNSKAEIDRIVGELVRQKVATIDAGTDGKGRPTTILKWTGVVNS